MALSLWTDMHGGAGYVLAGDMAGAGTTSIPPPFGPPHLLSVSIGYRMITATGSTGLSDVIIGDSYPLILSGTLSVPGTFTVARLMVKRNKADADNAALIDSSITSVLSAAGQIQTDGTAGPYAVLFTLTGTQTGALTPSTGQPYFYGWYEIRLTSAAGAEYTPVRQAQLIAKPRLILAS